MTETGLSLGDLVREGWRLLAGSGTPDPRREALRIWAGLAGAAPADLALRAAEPVSAEATARFREALARRAAGEPLAYVTGWTGFRHLTVRCDRRALIPRPETEGLVDLVLARQPRGRAVDVGTGTGCIALSLVLEGHYAQVLGVDRSAPALALARENGRAAGAAVGWLWGDLATAIAPATVDVLVANPPYVTEAEYRRLDPSVRDWEPADALVSGPDGLEATRRLLADGRRVLRPGGWLALELDAARAGPAAALAGEAGWAGIAVLDDLFGRNRYLIARRAAWN